MIVFVTIQLTKFTNSSTYFIYMYLVRVSTAKNSVFKKWGSTQLHVYKSIYKSGRILYVICGLEPLKIGEVPTTRPIDQVKSITVSDQTPPKRYLGATYLYLHAETHIKHTNLVNSTITIYIFYFFRVDLNAIQRQKNVASSFRFI